MTLIKKALAYLTDRAIAENTAATAGLWVTDNAREVDPAFYPRPAIVLPYSGRDGQGIGFCRVRYLDPPEVGGVRRKIVRYQQPKGTSPEAYLPTVAGLCWETVLSDPAQPLVITEGEIKALSVSVNTGIPTIGLGGVFMWADHKQALPLFDGIDWTRRKVFIVFDSDIDSKPGVQLAEARLAQWLLRQRAHVFCCRLPPAENGGKQGADDYIVAQGAQALVRLVQEARSLTDLDMRVMELNTEVAYLDGEEKIIELATGNLIRKDSFTSGSRFSTLRVPVQAGAKVKLASVAQAWLTHSLATRYANTLFAPGGDAVVYRDGATWLNSWREQPCAPGDVALFLRLTEFLFADTLQDEWDFPIRLLAYKAQHQTFKIPIAIMLIGGQGSGKSLWASLARSAFGQWAASKTGKNITQDWNGFLEHSLLVTIDDVSARQMRANIETLRAWISEPRVERVEKYLKNREVDNFALFIFTSNHRDAGAFAFDDRRFLVVGAPKLDKAKDYYDPFYAWLRSGKAGPAIYHYLLAYDLAGWEPPITAPLTAEKRMAFEESLSDFERLARDMQRSDINVVVQWLAAAEQWAYSVIGAPGHTDTPRANEVLLAVQAFPIRPWYSADELCQMFPHMLAELHGATRRWSSATLPGKVSTALRNCGINFLKNIDDPDGFVWRGRKQQFLVICPAAGIPTWMTQTDFDDAMAKTPNYQPAMALRA